MTATRVEAYCSECGAGPLRMLTDHSPGDRVECEDCGDMAAFLARRETQRRVWREKAKKAYARRTSKHRVYRYVFPDGAEYVGVTCDTLARRERAHRRDCSVLGRRLDGGWDPEVREVVAECDDRAEAEALEARLIAKVPRDRRLNVLTPVEDWRRNG